MKLTLRQDLILYCEKVESSLREDNERLAEDAKNARLDLTDSIASRRELQKHVEYYRAELFNVTKDYDSLKVISLQRFINQQMRPLLTLFCRSETHISPF